MVAVIGDGALTGGIAYEALNHAGHLGIPVLVILNDNTMSIEKNVGAMSAYLSRLRTEPTLYRFRRDMERRLQRLPGVGDHVAAMGEQLKDSIKAALVPGMLFEDLGFTYVGVIDGHDIEELRASIRRSLAVDGPVLLHCRTVKGKGYAPAEKQPGRYHGTPRFSVETGKNLDPEGPTTFTRAFGEAVVELARSDERIVGITAAMATGTGLNLLREALPERFFDVGIAEAHAVAFAAGLAVTGKRPDRGHLLDLPAAGLRPGDPRRLPAGAARGVRGRPRRPGGGGRPDPSRSLRPVVPADHPRAHRVRAQARGRTAAHAGHRAHSRRPVGHPLSALGRHRGAARAAHQAARRALGGRGAARVATSSCSRPGRPLSGPRPPRRSWPQRGIEATVAGVRRVHPLDGEAIRAAGRAITRRGHRGGQRAGGRLRLGHPRVHVGGGALPARRARLGLPDAFVCQGSLEHLASRRGPHPRDHRRRGWSGLVPRARPPARLSLRRPPAVPRAARIRLDELVFSRGLAPSRSAARALIMAGLVLVEGQVSDKAGTPVDLEAAVDSQGAAPVRVAGRGQARRRTRHVRRRRHRGVGARRGSLHRGFRRLPAAARRRAGHRPGRGQGPTGRQAARRCRGST